MTSKPSFYLSFFIPILLVYAPFHSGSYGFYVFMKIAVCGYALYQGYKFLEAEKTVAMIPFAGIALLFQPFWSWGIDRDTWAPIDFIVGGFIVLFIIVGEMRNRKASADTE